MIHIKKADGCSAHYGDFPSVKECAEDAALKGVSLSGVVLMNCDLTGADLSGIDLTHANLTGSDFTGATLAGARLEGAALFDVKGNDAQIKNGEFDGVPFIYTNKSLTCLCQSAAISFWVAAEQRDVSESVWGVLLRVREGFDDIVTSDPAEG